MVKFFAKYCEPCQRQLPGVEQLHERAPEIAVIGVDEDERERDAQVLAEEHHLTFPVVLDRDNILAGRFRVNELPRTFVVDRKGDVRWVGGANEEEGGLERAIHALERD